MPEKKEMNKFTASDYAVKIFFGGFRIKNPYNIPVADAHEFKDKLEPFVRECCVKYLVSCSESGGVGASVGEGKDSIPAGRRDIIAGSYSTPFVIGFDAADRLFRQKYLSDLNTGVIGVGKDKNVSSNVDNIFNQVLKDNIDLKGKNRFERVVNQLKEKFKSIKYNNETELSYTYARLMERLGKEFGPDSNNHISYKFADKWNDKNWKGNLFKTDGTMRKTPYVDCSNFQTVGINILGLAKKEGYNINEYSPKIYNYDSARKREYEVRGPTNFRYNESLFKIAKNNSDLTGTIGALNNGSYYSHVYTSLNKDSSIISDSAGGVGVRSIPLDPIKHKRWKDNTVFLRLKLPDWKKK